MKSVVDDRFGHTIYADNIKLIKSRQRKTPSSTVDKAGLQLLAIDRSELYSRLNDMGMDNIITPIEKRSLEREWSSLSSSKDSSLQKADEYGLSESDESLAVINAHRVLADYLTIVLDPTLMNENSDISHLGAITPLFQTYYSAKSRLDESLFRLESGLLSGLDDRTRFIVSISCSTGSVVPLDNSPSKLTVSLFSEGIEVTDQYEDSDFLWTRNSENKIEDEVWGEDGTLVGKDILVSHDDLVQKSAKFNCLFRHFYSDTMYFEAFGFINLSEEIPGPPGEDVIAVQLFSSNGNIFRSGQCFTTVSVTVWKGDEDITSLLDESRFTWKRTSGNPMADEQWNTSSKALNRKSLELSPDDVSGRAVFACFVEI